MYVKVCGITHLDDAVACIEAGVDVLGFNLIPASKRYIAPERAREIVERVRCEVTCVAVVADRTPEECLSLAASSGCERLQLHGHESPADVTALHPRAFKAVRVGDAADVAEAAQYPGHPLLVDAKLPGQLGGTGQQLDGRLVIELAATRPLILAGGLTPENVEGAVVLVQPWGVDVASGVETAGDPRRKDWGAVRRFVDAARRSSRTRHSLSF